MKKLNYAERYMKRGWELTPVVPPKHNNPNTGKQPILKDWTNNPVITMEEAEEYWSEELDYNMGILTGEASNLIVLDIDYPEKFEEFLNKHPECRETYTVERDNADGRKHYYFSLPEGMEAPKTRTVKSTGWGDLLSNGKQVVAPPSSHYTGGKYVVVNDVDPLPFKAEYLEDLLLKKDEPKKKKDNAIIPEVVTVSTVKFPDHIESRINAGAEQGQRNSTLFKLGTDLRNMGYSSGQVRDAVRRYCAGCSPEYDLLEGEKTIESVFKYNIQNTSKLTLKKLNYWTKKGVDDDGETERKTMPLEYDKVRDKLLVLAQNWIAKANGNIFILPKEKGAKIDYIKDKTEFFAGIGCEYQGVPDWKTSPKYMNKDEAFSAVLPCLEEYTSIENAPHYPSIEGVFYNHPELPDPDYDVLDQLLDFFTPETDEDRSLLKAFFLTALWGGMAGQRAPFLITSKDGRGVGKSALAETAASILGQTAIQASTKDKAGDIVTRLLSPDALQKRVVIFDNESGNSRLSNDQVASLFTTHCISGRALYKGEGSRPNNMLWVITLNSPSLDSDFAVRCVPVALKRPKYDANWKSELTDFINANKEIIQATLIDILKQDEKYIIPAGRWGDWEKNVLAKVPGINLEKVQKLIKERQKQFDDEQFELELIVDEIKKCITANRLSLEDDHVFISYESMTTIVRKATEVRWSKTNVLKRVRELIDKGDIPDLTDKRHRTYGNGFRWIGKNNSSDEVKVAKYS